MKNPISLAILLSTNIILFFMVMYIFLMWAIPQNELVNKRVEKRLSELKYNCGNEIRNYLTKTNN